MLYNKVRNFNNQKIDGTTTASEQTDNLVLYLLDALRAGTDGDVVEFGCYIGETSKYLKKCLLEWSSTKKLYVYDSFEGLPPLGDHEKGTGWTEGGFKTTEEVLITNFLNNKIEPPIIKKGWFKDLSEGDIPQKICFAFLDGDFYESIYSSLEKVWDRVSDGGYVFFHDYERPDLPGVKAAVDDFFKGSVTVHKIVDQLAVIKKGHDSIPFLEPPKTNLTVVTGLWNLGREGRDFESHYLEHFKNILGIPCNMFIYIEAKYEHIIWERRSQDNTFVKVYELNDVKNLYSPFWENTQKIRTSEEWLNITGWLRESPQAKLEWYNPVVQSKMFMMHDVTIWNPFNSKYFLWVDGGLTNTVPTSLLTNERFYKNITKYLDPFVFLSFDYKDAPEIHGMKIDVVHRLAGDSVNHVCRGGMFGGTKRAIHYAHAQYYGLLEMALKEGAMGTEETIFAIMSVLRPNYFRRYELPGTIISPFVEDVIADKAVVNGENKLNKEYHEDKNRTAIYFLTFNKPRQIEMTLEHLKRWNSTWLKVKHKYVIDNSTNEEARDGVAEVCKKYGFVHIPMKQNIGISGGRQFVAEHFDSIKDLDYYIFFEDDMTLNGDDLKTEFCRNGFRRYVPDLWNIMHGIMAKEGLDFLKLTYTEVFMDNQEQVSWYNVEQSVRDSVWPYYSKLPVHGFDPNCPKTEYDYLDNFDGVTYAIGDVYYCNWPLLFSKAGNKKVFLDKKWDHPHERLQMAYVFERQLNGEIKSGVLLASPITHDRKEIYAAEERKEG